MHDSYVILTELPSSRRGRSMPPRRGRTTLRSDTCTSRGSPGRTIRRGTLCCTADLQKMKWLSGNIFRDKHIFSSHRCLCRYDFKHFKWISYYVIPFQPGPQVQSPVRGSQWAPLRHGQSLPQSSPHLPGGHAVRKEQQTRDSSLLIRFNTPQSRVAF